MSKMKNKRSYYVLIICIILFFLASCDENQSDYLLTIISGNYQFAESGEQLTNPVIVRVQGRDNEPRSNVTIKFSVVSGGGTLDNPEVSSDSDGLALINWTLGQERDPIMKALVQDEQGNETSVYIFANTDLIFNWEWISDLIFYRNLSEVQDHDDRILQSDNVLIFSDASSDDAKAIMAKSAEEGWHYILQLLEISGSEEVGIFSNDNNTIIPIYANCKLQESGGGISFGVGHASIMIDAPDAPRVGGINNQYYRRKLPTILKHEMTHYLQWLLLDSSNEPIDTPLWFMEGIAENISGGTCPVIENKTEFLEWINDPGHRNPLNIEGWSDFSDSDQPYEYYSMFGLVIRYFVDPMGGNKTYIDLKNMLRDMHTTRSFTQSFTTYFGISTTDLKDNLYTILGEYWDRIETK